MKKFILALIALFAIAFAIGSVGAFENGNIGFWQFAIQVVISVIVEWATLSRLYK